MQFLTHYNRALRTADKRYARVFEKMGYGKPTATVETPAKENAEEILAVNDDEKATPKRRVDQRRPFSAR